MKQNNRWRFILVILIVAWSLYEVYPPTSRDLVQEFTSRADNQDAAFTNILQRLAPLQAARPDRAFANLQDAIGTNSIEKYFPFVTANNELYPTTFILNQIQRLLGVRSCQLLVAASPVVLRKVARCPEALTYVIELRVRLDERLE